MNYTKQEVNLNRQNELHKVSADMSVNLFGKLEN